MQLEDNENKLVTDDTFEVEVIEDEKAGVEKPESEPASPDTSAKAGEDDDEELDSYGDKVKKRISKEVWKRREEERKRAAAEERAAALEAQLQQLTRRAQTSDETAIRAQEDYLKAEQERIQTRYKKAYDEGDTDEMFKATQALAEHQAKLYQLDAYKRSRQQPQPQQQRPQAQPQQAPQADPRAVEWASENTWFGRDPAKTGAAYAIDAQLKSEGIDPRSDDYYAELDRRLSDAFPDLRKPEPQKRPAPAQPVAGVSRSTGEKRKIQLTASEAAMAQRLGVSYEDYARHKNRSS